MRTALMIGSVVVAAVSAFIGVGYLAFDSVNGPLLFVLSITQTGLGVGVLFASRGPARRWPDTLAVVFMTVVLIVPLATIAVEPSRLLLVGVSLAIIPSLAALYLPWPRRIFLIWIFTFCASVVVSGALVAAAQILTVAEAADFITAVAIGVTFGVVGQGLLFRRDLLLFEREEDQRRLMRRAAEQQRQLEALNERLETVARTDPLTGAGNRLKLDEDLAGASDRLERYGRPVSIAMCDVDHFKRYNDRYGHVAGDHALITIVDIMRSGLRPADSLYRYGGEEILVILPEQEGPGALAAIDRVRDAVHDAGLDHEANPPWGVLTLSAGIVSVEQGMSPDMAFRVDRADDALYRAKAGGRNRSVLADRLPASAERD